MTDRVIVTGADGFVGRALIARLRHEGRAVEPVTRAVLARRAGSPAPVEYVDFAHWPALLDGAAAVIHLAARAHVVRDAAANPLAEFRRANVAGTERLLEAAVRCGVPRFVFVSSRTAGTATQAVIVRPPLVYGPGVKGNFLRLLRLVHSGLPLPFAGLDSARSFVGVENLCSLLVTCIEHPAAAGRTLLVADGEDVTLPGLLAAIGRGLGHPARLFRAPWGLMEALAKLAGRGGDLARLAGSLRVDDSATRQLLGWQPGVRFEEGIRAMAEWYLEARAS